MHTIDDVNKDYSKSFDVHVGLTSDYADMFTAKMEKDGHDAYEYDDGWEVWGESRGHNGNDENTHHVVIRVGTVEDSVALAVFAAKRYKDILVPLRRQTAEDLNGIIVAVTSATNYSEILLQIYQNEYKSQTVTFRSLSVHL